MDGLDAFHVLAETRKRKPLVHILMNMVTANNAANAVLQVGGSPVMADSIEEVEQIAQSANALVLNAAVLSPDRIKAMMAAGACANKKGIPVILDPAGVGASRFRQNALAELLNGVHIDVIRGNASEIACLCGLDTYMKGVDSESGTPAGEMLALTCAKKLRVIAAVTGEVDAVSDGQSVYKIQNGHYYMSRVTGFGCMTAAVTGAFCGSVSDLLSSTVAAMVCMGVAGQMAAAASLGPGSFLPNFYDCLYLLGRSDLIRFANIQN